MRVYSIFRSFDGEVNRFYQGTPSTFIRMSGCGLRCKYCDTVYAQRKNSGKNLSVDQVIDKVKLFETKKVTITGGEPLLQKEELLKLVSKLHSLDFQISIETNGSILLPCFSSEFNGCWVMDYKLPSSGQGKKMVLANFERLGINDFVKFVIMNRQDYLTALVLIKQFETKMVKPNIAFSPVLGHRMNPKILAEWMIEDKVEAIYNLQIHKFIWPNVGEGEEH